MMLDIKNEGQPLTAARSKQSRATFFMGGALAFAAGTPLIFLRFKTRPPKAHPQ